MRKRVGYEPERDRYGIPLPPKEELEVDRYDYLRPEHTYFGDWRAFEAPLDANISETGVVKLQTTLATPPWSAVFVLDQSQAYDIRVCESASVYRCYLGILGEVAVGRDRQEEAGGPVYADEGRFLIQEVPVVGILVWLHRALNRSEIGEILASPGGFFRHIRLTRPQVVHRGGSVSNTSGSTLV